MGKFATPTKTHRNLCMPQQAHWITPVSKRMFDEPLPSTAVFVGPPTACRLAYPGRSDTLAYGAGMSSAARQAKIAEMYARMTPSTHCHSSDDESAIDLSAPPSPDMLDADRKSSCDSVACTALTAMSSTRDGMSSAVSSPTKTTRRSRSVERRLNYDAPMGRSSRASSLDSAHVSRECGLQRCHSSSSLDMRSSSFDEPVSVRASAIEMQMERPLPNASCNGLCLDVDYFTQAMSDNDGVTMLTEADVDYMLYKAEVKPYNPKAVRMESTGRRAARGASRVPPTAVRCADTPKRSEITFKRVETSESLHADASLQLNPHAAEWTPGADELPTAMEWGPNAHCPPQPWAPPTAMPWRA